MNHLKNSIRWEAPVCALEKWDSSIKAMDDDKNTINIYDQIGEDFFSDGMTAKIVSSVLRKAKGEDVTVNVNSPGGDFFEGIAIYNLLKNYEGGVNVNVVGLAASAASVIALAGDNTNIAKSGFFMIHNAWTIALGNKSDMEEVAGMLAKFDKSMVELYAEHTGMTEKQIIKMMDGETWIGGEDSVEQGFANALLGEDKIEIDEDDKQASALRKIDTQLAKSGMARNERRKLIKDLSDTSDEGTPSATNTTPSAGLTEALLDLKQSI